MLVRNVLVLGLSELPPLVESALRRHGCRLTCAVDPARDLAVGVTAGDFDLILCEPAKGLECGPEATPGAWLALMPPLDAEHTCTELRPEYLIDIWAPPFSEPQMELAVQRAERLNALLQENFHHRTADLDGAGEMAGRAPAMQQVFQRLDELASCDVPVLLVGACGTGKDLAARALHVRSSRAGGRFVRVQSAGYPDSLLEKELLGYPLPVGALAGEAPAVPLRRRAPYVELARGGTLALDIDGIRDVALQEKLLRLCQESAGAAGVRVCCMTRIEQPEAAGFHAELSRRLAVVKLPTVCERGDDVALLAEHFLRRIAPLVPRPATQLSAEARAALLEYRWPGNVRELQQVIEQAAFHADGALLTVAALGFAPASAAGPVSAAERSELQAATAPAASAETVSFRVGQSLDEVEREMIARTLVLTRGNRTQAAALLGISVRTLFTKLREIEQQQKSPAARPDAAKTDGSR